MRATIATLLSVAFLATGSHAQINLTALGSAEGESTLECWQMSPFTVSSMSGTSGALSLALGDTASSSYTIMPSHFDGGLHNAPALQYVILLSGLAYISLPNSADDVWIQGGKYGLLIATDTADVSQNGHRTQFPGDGNSVVIQIPLADGESFNYTLLHNGPCDISEMTGI